MSRPHSANNLAEINASHLHVVTLVKLDFDTPVYVHSGVGTITYDGDDYLGVGHYGGISNAKETENLRPVSLQLELSGVDSTLIGEALNAGRYGDLVEIYEGYRADDGTLVADPWKVWAGKLEYQSIKHGVEGAISITVTHEIAALEEKSGRRCSDEDQQAEYSGDTFFKNVTNMAGLRLVWGGQRIPTGNTGGRRDRDFQEN